MFKANKKNSTKPKKGKKITPKPNKESTNIHSKEKLLQQQEERIQNRISKQNTRLLELVCYDL